MPLACSSGTPCISLRIDEASTGASYRLSIRSLRLVGSYRYDHICRLELLYKGLGFDKPQIHGPFVSVEVGMVWRLR